MAASVAAPITHLISVEVIEGLVSPRRIWTNVADVGRSGYQRDRGRMVRFRWVTTGPVGRPLGTQPLEFEWSRWVETHSVIITMASATYRIRSICGRRQLVACHPAPGTQPTM